jgi:predicted ATPase
MKVLVPKVNVSEDGFIQLNPSGKYSDKTRLNSIINEMGFGESIRLESNEGIKKVFIREGDTLTNIANARSGFKQVFPIILSMLINRREDAISMIEQPELHLHPKLQCQLMDVLVKYRFRQKYIFETHSEHMIRKLQLMIAKGILSKEDVAVYYFDNVGETTKIKEMDFDDNGFFKEPWPNGFFDDSYNLARELIYASKN